MTNMAGYTQWPDTLKYEPDTLSFVAGYIQLVAGYTQGGAGYTQPTSRIRSVVAGYTQVVSKNSMAGYPQIHFFSDVCDTSAAECSFFLTG